MGDTKMIDAPSIRVAGIYDSIVQSISRLTPGLTSDDELHWLSRKIFELGLNAEMRGDLDELNLFVAIERYILKQIESNRES
jgi:hypothetical protein